MKPTSNERQFEQRALWITAKALEILNQFMACQKSHIKTHGKKNFTLRVNKRWQLFSKDDGQNWQLLTNNDYNSLIDT